ncbi:hypothetical protein ACFQJ7_11980 [Halovenus rubra]|uniref:Uncharacterized protein n=2 Tax=Halovenus rubra TaxID=869890 RepID=A0ABD5XA43_9EURY|nr:hypothetical protein [Halovenus rubra]
MDAFAALNDGVLVVTSLQEAPTACEQLVGYSVDCLAVYCLTDGGGSWTELEGLTELPSTDSARSRHRVDIEWPKKYESMTGCGIAVLES